MLNLPRFWNSGNSLFKAGLIALILAGLTACNLNSTYKTTTQGNQVRVYLHDAPGPYGAVVINVKKVEIHSTDNSADWLQLNSQAFSIDLLTLSGGASPLLIGGANNVPSGTYSKLRITLDSGNKIQVNSTVHNLSLDTTAAPGGVIDIPINSQVDANNNATLSVDFDVSRSVHMNPSDSTYTLKPVVTAIEALNTGSITGTISPLITQPAVYLMNGPDTLTSTYTSLATGQFAFPTLPAGSYDLLIHPLVGNYKDTTLTNVAVTAQQNTNLPLVTLKQK